MSEIRIGQRWQDRDKREPGRIMTVVGVSPTHVRLETPGGHHATKIRIDRLPKTWRLYPDPPPGT